MNVPASSVSSALTVLMEPRGGSLAISDRKSTRLNSSHSQISYAVFCLKKKKHHPTARHGVRRVQGAGPPSRRQSQPRTPLLGTTTSPTIVLHPPTQFSHSRNETHRDRT